MNILYLIGNGLDIAQGMNTRYQNFYDIYSKPTDLKISPAALKLREEISKDYQTWADMEYSFGEYTSKIDRKEFDNVYYDMSDELRTYLLGEQKKYKPTDLAKDLALKDLINPYETLLERDKDEVKSFIIKHSRSSSTGNLINIYIDIISFNYTDTLERLLSERIGKAIGNINQNNVYIKQLIHIHGKLDKHMILGVNDVSQIHNEEYIDDSSIRDMLVKPESNIAIRSNNDIICERLIQNADMIVIFGMSLGATDKIWWQAIGNKIRFGNTKLIIFEYIDQPLNYLRAHKFGAMRNNVLNKFTSHLKLSPMELETINENTYINFSTDFLSNTKEIQQ